MTQSDDSTRICLSVRVSRRLGVAPLILFALAWSLHLPAQAHPRGAPHTKPAPSKPPAAGSTQFSVPGLTISSDGNSGMAGDAGKDGEDEAQAPLQPIEAGPFGDRVDLRGRWLFNMGTQANFSDPGLDDSHWRQVDTSKPLFMQRIWNPNDLWYRLHIHLIPGSHGLALALAKVGGSYRVYANGRELGGHGTMQGRGDYLIARWDNYSIPDDLASSGDLVIVVHAIVGTVNRTNFTILDGLSPSSLIYLGPAGVLARDQIGNEQQEQSGSLLALWSVLFVLSLSLALLVRKTPIYALLAIYAGSHIVNGVLNRYAWNHYLSNTQWLTLPMNLALAVGAIAGLEFCRQVAGSARRLWFTVFEGFYVLSLVLLYLAASGAVSFIVYSVADQIARASIYAVIGILLLFGVARGRRNAIILAGVGGLYVLYLGAWEIFAHVHLATGFWTDVGAKFVAALPPERMADFALIIALFILLVAQTLDMVRERGAISTEIEAARTMQRLLLTRSSEPTPGYTVETAYLPAGEVGGDFFLVSPTRDGSLAAVVGDVSGKGLSAAMQVSMILGVLRREPSRDPATVLCSMNEALLSQQDTGFTTACAVELCADGRYTIANAGHISPYLTGHGRSLELIAPPAFPLGLAGDQSYDVLRGQLQPGQRLVLMSDGIVEARARGGELYGFDRLLPLTLRPAGEIAATALAFGQEDDITVVTLSCQFIEVVSMAAPVRQAAAPAPGVGPPPMPSPAAKRVPPSPTPMP